MVVPPAVTEAAVAECVRLGIKQIWMQPGAESEAAVAACRGKRHRRCRGRTVHHGFASHTEISSMTPHRLLGLLAILLLAVTFGRPAFAADDHDPSPPMRWNEMLACQSVVLAKYQSHQDKILSLTVLYVLKGDHLKPGDTVKVSLENRYSCQDGDKFSSPLPPGVIQQTVPQICYQTQMGNPAL